MAERNMSKPRPSKNDTARNRARAAPEREGAGTLQAAVDRLESRVLELKRERDAFEAELAAARAEIAALEAARTEAINRIDWVLDSLHTVLQDES